MQRGRGRGRSRFGAHASRLSRPAPPSAPPAGFGDSSSSSSSSDALEAGPSAAHNAVKSDGPSTVKRPRISENRIFLPTPLAGDFLDHLKEHDDEIVPSRTAMLPDEPEAAPRGSFDSGDPTTTNVFVGNLHPDTDEDTLQRAFGRFGALSSIKIMHPRNADELARGHNSGFVSFVHRPDAEAAFRDHHAPIDGKIVRLSWGKGLRREQIHIAALPGQLYGAAPGTRYGEDDLLLRGNAALPRVLVQPPLDLARRRKLDVLAAEVAAAPETSAAVAAREMAAASQHFSFLWDEGERGSDDALYYQWRLFSYSTLGGSDTRWRTAPFAMFPGGPLVDPPTCSMPLNNPPVDTVQVLNSGANLLLPLTGTSVAAGKENSGADAFTVSAETSVPRSTIALINEVWQMDSPLDADERAELERLVDATANGERISIGAAMVFCIDHSRCAGGVASVLAGRLLALRTSLEVAPSAGLAVLHVISDLLANGDAISGAHAHRARLGVVMEVALRDGMAEWLKRIPGKIAAQSVIAGVEKVFVVWQRMRVFDEGSLRGMRKAVFGAVDDKADGSVMEIG